MSRNIIIALVIGLVIGALLGLSIPRGGQEAVIPVTNILGSSPEHSELNWFRAGLIDGGTVVATSTDDTSATFLNTDLIQGDRVSRLINFNPSKAGITATLPATTTLRTFVPNAGDSREVMICNATSTAATTFTLAVGTGMNLQQATSTMAIRTGWCAQLEFVRNSDKDIEVFYDLGY